MVSVGCEVMELPLLELAGLALRGHRTFKNHAQSSPGLLSTLYKQNTMDDMDTSQHEVDPLSDPEERRVLYSALDSFR